MAAFQPKVVRVPLIDTLTNSLPSVAYFIFDAGVAGVPMRQALK